MSSLDDEDDQVIGRPIQAPLTSAKARSTSSPGAREFLSEEAGVKREDIEPRPDEGPGRPMQPALGASPLTDIDHERVRRERAKEEEAERRRVEEFLVSEAAIIRLPGFLAHSVVVSFLLGMTALLGLFVFAQVNTTLASLAVLADGWRYTGYVALGLLTACFLYAVARCVGFYFRLRTNRPISIKGLEKLSQRTKLRWLVHEKKSDARQALAAYLQSFPISNIAEGSGFSGLLTDEKLRLLEKARADLLDMNRFASNDAWFERFASKFQAILDEAAEARIAYFSRRVAVMTAVSPNALVDTILVGYCSFIMLTDLCRIYNLRIGNLGTLVFLGHTFFNAYIAGQINDLEPVTEASLESIWKEIGFDVGSQAAGAVFGKVASKVGARAGSGLINWLLLRRLGKYAKKSLCPVQGP